MDEGDKIVKKHIWYLDHPLLFRLNYLFTEKRKIANWEIYIIIFIVAMMFILIGYIMGSGRIPFSG